MGQRTTKGATVFHLVVSRGILECFGEIVERVFPKLHPSAIPELLNATNKKGKTVLDLARYNKEIAKIVRDNGGKTAYEGVEEERNYVPEWHHWNRKSGTSGRSVASGRPRVLGGATGIRRGHGEYGLWPEVAGIRRLGNHTSVSGTCG